MLINARGTVKELQQLQIDRDQVTFDEGVWLKARGWKETCDTPGGFWLFQKKMKDGRVLLMQRGMAMAIEQNLPRR